jgi:hypothetical protein
MLVKENNFLIPVLCKIRLYSTMHDTWYKQNSKVYNKHDVKMSEWL